MPAKGEKNVKISPGFKRPPFETVEIATFYKITPLV